MLLYPAHTDETQAVLVQTVDAFNHLTLTVAHLTGALALLLPRFIAFVLVILSLLALGPIGWIPVFAHVTALFKHQFNQAYLTLP